MSYFKISNEKFYFLHLPNCGGRAVSSILRNYGVNNVGEVVKNDQLFELFLDNISPIKEHLNVIRKPSTEAAKTFEDGSLDFVFIDACHEYQDVKDDIESWIDKIKPGGVIAGHDYLHPDVKQAVDEFFGDCVIFRNPMENCWIIHVE